MGEWMRVKLGEICSRVCSGGTPRSNVAEYYEGGSIPWLNTKEVTFGRIYSTEKCITESGLVNSSAKWIEANAVVVAMYGATAGNVAITRIPLTTNQACCNLQIHPEKADADFVFYYLKWQYHELCLLANGAAQQNLNAQVIKDFEIDLPPLPTQRRIAAVLGVLDDKIEVNRKICENLEAQAQALFKAWFVDFEPFGGKRPEGWKDGTIREHCKTVLGGTPSRDCPEYWGGNVAWINSGKVNEFRVISPSETITELGLKNSAAKLLPKKTTVLAITGATLGQVSLLEIDAAANQSVIGILESEKVPYTFIYPYVLSIIKELIEHQTGGAQQHINKDDVNSFRMSVPDAETMRKYDSTVRPMFEMIANKTFESRALAAMRDALLPKLMSGELAVEKVEV